MLVGVAGCPGPGNPKPGGANGGRTLAAPVGETEGRGPTGARVPGNTYGDKLYGSGCGKTTGATALAGAAVGTGTLVEVIGLPTAYSNRASAVRHS